MHSLIANFACVKSERRWLLGATRSYLTGVEVSINDNYILKPDLYCGELTQLVVSGKEAGLIRSPIGRSLRYLKADATLSMPDIDEKQKYLLLIEELSLKEPFSNCGPNYLNLMVKVLTELLGDSFDQANFISNVV